MENKNAIIEEIKVQKEETKKNISKKENKTKSFVLRIDSDKMNAIEKWASDEFRSTNGQIQWILEQALRNHGRIKK